MLFPLRPTKESPRMFENDILDAVSRTHWIFVPVLFLPALGFLFWYGLEQAGISWTVSLILALVGTVCWTITEYWLHRTLFHWIPDSKWGPKMHFFVHGVHHDSPDDKFRLVMPPAGSLTLFLLFFGIFWLILGKYSFPFHAGFTFGYLLYDLTHYYVHHAKPTNRVMKNLQNHHLKHHFHPKYSESRFAITVPVWDHLFGTYEPVAPESKSEHNITESPVRSCR